MENLSYFNLVLGAPEASSNKIRRSIICSTLSFGRAVECLVRPLNLQKNTERLNGKHTYITASTTLHEIQ